MKRKLWFWILILIMLISPQFMLHSAPTTSWDETTPADSESASQGASRIRELKTQLREVIDVDHKHDSSGNGSTWGYHETIHLVPTSDLGTGSSTATLLGSQTDGSDSELVYTDASDSDVQITKDGALNAVALRGAIGGTTPAAITGTVGVFTTSIAITGTGDDGKVITGVEDDDSLTSNSDTLLATQQSIKAYADTKLGGLSAYTSEDSDSNTLLVSINSGAQHAYLAQSDGYVCWTGEIDLGTTVIAYVDTDSNPPSGGVVVGSVEATDSMADQRMSISFPVASGEYFELVASDTDTPANQSLVWKSFGTLSKPVDQN